MPTIQEIQGWLAANPTATDADIRSAMDQYGVSTDLMAQATGLNAADVQSRYNAAQPATLATPATAPSVKDQLLQQWGSINPAYMQSTLKQSGMTLEQLADQFAQQAQAAGITDLGGLKLGTATEKVMGPEATTDWGSPQELEVARNYLTLGEGDQAKKIGYIGAGQGQQYLDDPDALNRILHPYAFKDQDQGLDSLGRLFGTAEGGGWTSGEVIKGPDGQLMIVPKWGESSDKDELLKAAQVLMTVAPGLGQGIGGLLGAQGLTASALGNALVGGTLSELSGGDFLKGAVAGGVGSLAGPALSGLGESAVGALGAQGATAEAVKNAVAGAGRNALGAVVSGNSLGDALLTGAVSGAATGAMKSSVGDLGLPASVTSPLSAAAVAALTGRDPTKAAVNALISEAMKGSKDSLKTMPGLDEYNYKALEPLELTPHVTGDELLRELGLEDRYDYSALDQVLPGGYEGNLEPDFFVEQGRDGTVVKDTAGNVGYFANTGEWVPISDVGEAPTGGNLEQDFTVVHERDRPAFIEDTAGNVGYFSNTGDWVPIDDTGAAPTGGNLEQDFVVEQNRDGAIVRDDAGNRGYFDETGNWKVVTGEDEGELRKILTEDTDSGPGTKTDTKTGTTTKTDTTKTTTDTSKSGTDWSALLALLGMMAGQGQQAAPQYQLADVRGGLELAKALGLDLGSLYGSNKA